MIPPKVIRTLLVDDNNMFLDALSGLLSDEPGIEVVGRAVTGIDAVHLVDQTQPDLVLMDFFMIGMNGLETTELLKIRPKPPKVIVLSLYADRAFAAAARKAGADDFVRKQDLPDGLREAIARVFRDDTAAGV